MRTTRITASPAPQARRNQILRWGALATLAAIAPLLTSADLKAATAPLQVAVTLSVPSPQPLGTMVTLNFSAKDTNPGPGNLNYKVEVQSPGSSNFKMVHDFAIATTFIWAQNLVEGPYNIRVTARDNNYITVYSQIVIPYTISPIVTSATQWIVTRTNHPLVALFSAPACAAGSQFRVQYQSAVDPVPYNTNLVNCHGPTKTLNVLVAGLRASTSYAMTAQVFATPGSNPQNGNTIQWLSGALPPDFPHQTVTVTTPYHSSSDSGERLTLLSFDEVYIPIAVDLTGSTVWYYTRAGQTGDPAPAAVQIERLLPGSLLTSTGYKGGYTGDGIWGNQTILAVLAQTDLAGNVIQETNVDRINEQLAALNAPDPIVTVNHDIRRLQNGNTLALASIQRVFAPPVQGITVPTAILGTMLIELDANFQVIWYWDAFDHAGGNGQLDLNRAAPLGETCTSANLGTDGCPSVLLTNPTNDWLHTNTLQYDPSDGNLIISMRNQDWVAKIDFKNGTGSGNILWLMGNGSEGLPNSFTMNNTTGDPFPWFSHQHDVEFGGSSGTPPGPFNMMSNLDNGNTRHAQCQGTCGAAGNSRGYLMNVDFATMTVTPTLLANLGYYAVAMGTAQPLENGDWEFEVGDIPVQYNGKLIQFELAAEVNPHTGPTATAGKIVYSEQAASPAYRGWRLADFYNVPLN